jgi:hypothetical protein
MPVILRTGPYRVYFFSNEPDEPPHVHVDRDGRSVKLWLRPIQVARNDGFGEPELNRIRRRLKPYERQLVRAWYTYAARR